MADKRPEKVSGPEPEKRDLSAERAFRALDEHAAEWVEPLREAAAGAVTGLSLAEVLRQALEAVSGTLRADAASILIADDAGSELVARTSVGLVVEVDLEVRIPRGEGYAGEILARAEPLVVDDLEQFEVRSPVLRESSLKSIAGVPLLAGERVVGVLHVSSKTPRHFTEEEVAFLERIAYPVAVAVERVRLFEIERRLRQAAELTAARLGALQEMTATLLSITDLETACAAIVDRAVLGPADSGGAAAIWVLERGRLRLVAGGPRSTAFYEIPLDDSYPVLEGFESGKPVFVESPEEMEQRWPAAAGAETKALAGFALTLGEERLGIMAVGYPEPHRFDENERAYLLAVAEQASLAVDRARAVEAERAAVERRAFLAETSLALTGRYASPEQMLENLARLAVPRLGDLCAVVRAQGENFEVIALAHDLEHLPAAIARRPAAMPILDEPGPLRRVFYSGRPAVLSSPGGRPPDLDGYEELAASIGLNSAMIVPLEWHGHVIGVMAFAACGSHPTYTEDDLELAEELAERAGRVVEDLTQRARERRLAERLTLALLPARLPSFGGLELTARYLPAEQGPVGGDWYDAFELPDGRLALVVGDVGGHGVEAASAMARLRNGLFAFASEGHEPAGTLERLSDLLGNDSRDWNLPDPIASVLFGALDRDRLSLQTTCAGHPPWLLVRGGRATTRQSGGRVLAAGLPARTAETVHQLEEGDLVVFMTDGLIERPDEDFDLSLDRLARAAEVHASQLIEDFADALVEATVPPGGRTDDCCLLALRIIEGRAS